MTHLHSRSEEETSIQVTCEDQSNPKLIYFTGFPTADVPKYGDEEISKKQHVRMFKLFTSHPSMESSTCKAQRNCILIPDNSYHASLSTFRTWSQEHSGWKPRVGPKISSDTGKIPGNLAQVWILG